ncbi:conserved hypothetical protein [Ixodes scapularis]|uniref:Protein phosphatase 2a regulatory subunit a n=1 Tax=Ixodes scapularis TaxID=6945 RepID=B7QEH4_IXOSC|nr:conserved hypothetical protein [Ixodes scapularis]|eukprot:XP_002413922.1 conserved hypothetical protein [Ixodes scapularis]
MAGTLEVETLEDEISKCNQASDDAPISLPPPVELESVHDVTIDRIASKLLKDNFILTALELHAELLESGRELPRLRDYFSNPGNFEKHSHSSAFDVSPVLPRTSSVQTFDSLDFARYSDDGEKQLDERVAVLEFELRKARETIKNLRANLTVDFEDWDDVGLNIPKPPDFLQLYRNYNKHARQWCSTTECAAQTEALDEPSPSAREQELKAVAFEKEVLAELSFKPVLPFEIMAETLSEMVEPSVPDSPLLTASKSPLRKRLPEERGNLPEEGSPIDSTIHKDDLDVAVFGVEQVTPAKLRESRPITTARCVVWRRKMSPAFLEALVSVGHPQSQLADMRLAWDVTHVAATGDEVVLMLSRCLPHIVPNVLLAKREASIPLLLAAINLHPDARERDALLNLLFNLTKRPDDDQRRVILAGLLSVAQCLGHARVEAELLPQCWEQISHKYPERRLLVAESCGYLAPQVASEIRSSLLLSMLQQMLKEEKEELVRQAAARSLAVLLAYVDDPDKFLQAVDLALLVVADEQPEMAEVAQSVLLPSVACWALEKGQLETALLTTLMKLLEDHVRALDMRSADGVMSLSQAEEQHSVNLVKALGAALPFLLVHVLESGPYVARLNLHDSISPCSLPADRLRPSENPLLEPATIVGDDSRTALLVTAFDEHIGQEWFKTWPAFDWLLSKFIPFLTNIATSTKPHSRSTVRALSELVRNFCQLFGCTFTHSKVKPAFSALLPLTDASSVASREALTNATAPIYACGVLTAFCSETDRRELVGFLKSLLFVVSLCDVSLASIQSTLLELGCDRNHQETLLAALWEGVVHASPLVRANAARLFELLVATVPDTLLKNRVAPALVTLASDPEISVRVGTVRPFGTILALSTQKELLDKAFLQLQTFLEDPQHRDNHCMQVEFIQMFASLGPNTEPRFRDEFILPHLAVLAIRNNQNASDSLRAEVAELLLEAYTALSCTYIPEQVISEAFLPGLRCLLEDARQVAPCHEAAVAAMIGNFEAKLDCSRDRTSSLTSPIASMEEMKRKMTKIFTTPPANARANLPNIFQLRKK